MKKLTNKALKEMVSKIETELNNKEIWELQNGCWLYKLEVKKDEIVVKIYDSEINEDYLEYAFVVDISENVVTLIKGMITYLYEQEINDRQSYVKATANFNKRKIKSLSLWSSRCNQERVDKIVQDLSNRYAITKKYESEIGTYKSMVSDFYNCMTTISPLWKIEDIKEAAIKRCNELNIKNIGISYIDSRLIVMKNNNDATAVLDKFDIEVDSYSNISMVVNQITSRLRKVA